MNAPILQNIGGAKRLARLKRIAGESACTGGR